jgi:CHASE2 domain-containing sensor protein
MLKRLLLFAGILFLIGILSPEALLGLVIILALGGLIVVHPIIAALAVGTPIAAWRRHQRRHNARNGSSRPLVIRHG